MSPVKAVDDAGPKPVSAAPATAKLAYATPRRGRRLVIATRRWVRDGFSNTFSREQLFSSLKSLAWVVPLTVLIWIYAEREQLVPLTNIPISVDVKCADPKKLAILVAPADGQVLVDLSGPRAQLDALREKLDPRGGSGPVQIDVPADLPPGRHPIATAMLSRDVRFSAVTVNRTNPSYLDVLIDPIVEREVTVKAPPEVTSLADAPAFTPSTVRVSGPQSYFENADKQTQGQLVAYADLATYKDIKVPGPHTANGIRVTLPVHDTHVVISPATVSAAIEVKRADATLKLKSVPVFAVAAPTMLNLYRISLPDNPENTFANVTVTGPEDQINLLRDENFEPRPVATFRVTRENAGKPTPVRFSLPEGVKVAPEDAQRTVTYTLTPRENPE
jgi:hypothetical protein